MATALKASQPGQAFAPAPIRVMLVDDSLVARSILARILDTHDGIDIVGEAETADAAIKQLSHVSVDLMLLDIEMPHRSGLDALPELLAHSDGANIMIVSSFAEESGPAAIKALSLGACDTLAKPGRFGYSGGFAQTLIDKVLRIGHATRAGASEFFERRMSEESWPPASVKCVAIGSSTGGLPAIHHIVAHLDPALDAPVLITQHLPETFMPFFARQLAAQCHRDVRVAQHDELLQPGVVYVAPGDAHLGCKNGRRGVSVELLTEDCGSHYRPSVDVMFDRVAKCYGGDVVAVICSGMGRDGANGAHRLAAEGATIFAQDAESSVVWGMPGAVVGNGDATAVLHPAEIARLMSKMVRS